MRECHRSRKGVAIQTDHIDDWILEVRRRYRSVPVRTFETDLTDGRWMWVTETALSDGWLLLQASDVSPLKANEATLRHARDQAILASITDSLTGLHNRRYVFDRLEELLASSRDLRCPFSIAMLDLDYFKRVNDTHGHDVGDQVLRGFATLVQRQVRPFDVVGRIGGEEFLILLPNTSGDGAVTILNRLRATLQGSALVPAIPTLRTSFSAGVAEADFAESPLQLLNRTDRALYAAKDQGRDSVVVLQANGVAGDYVCTR